jgi:hypothetical protein
MRKFLKALSLTACTAAMLGTGALQAGSRRSEPVQIPFEFKVNNKVLPAGTYRLQRGVNDAFSSLVNIKTGQRIQLLSPIGSETTKTKLVFEREGDGFVLKKLS